MEKTPLHQQKIHILSRLIKESSLTLEEALLLLQEEEEEEAPVTVAPSWTPGTASPWIQPYQGTWPISTSGSITVTNTNLPTGTTTYTTTTSSFSQSVLDDLTKATEDADL